MKAKSISPASSLISWLHKPTSWLLIIILVGGIFFRFYNTPSRFGFDKDPTRDILVTKYAVTHFSFPLVGPASGIGSFTFGPWYYYQLILFSLLIPGPFAAFYYIPLFSLLLIVVMYYVGKILHDETFGLVLAFLAAFSPSLVGPTNGLSNPNLIPPHAGASILLFLILFKRKESVWLSFIWGLIMGIGINDHYQMIPLLLLPAIFYVLNYKTAMKGLLLFIGGMVVSFLPFIYFNSINHWQTIIGFTSFLKNGGSNNYIPNSWHIYLLEFWPKFFSYIFSVPETLSFVIAGIIAIFYIYMVFVKRSLQLSFVLLAIVFVIFFVGLRYFNAERDYYYFLFLEPLLLIMVGLPIYSLIKVKYGKFLIAFILIIFFTVSLPKNFQGLNSNGDQIIARTASKTLETRFKTSTIAIYNCHQQRIQLAMGVAFLLTKDNFLADTGKKVGLSEDTQSNCNVPGSALQIDKGMYDFSSISESQLNKLGWFRISPETVYKNTVLWWTPQEKEI